MNDTSVTPAPAAPFLRGHAARGMLLKYKWHVVIGGAALIIAALGLLRWFVGPQVVVYPVIRVDLVRTVVASGHVETPFRVEIASQITATVADVLVAEGQSVTQGAPLVALETRELEAAVVQASGAMAQAEAKLRQIREVTQPTAAEAVKQANANFTNAEVAYDPANQLAKSGNGTRMALDDATKTLAVARSQVRSAELQVFTNNPGGSDFVMAETQLTQARAADTTARVRLGYATITAPRNGVLITRSVERGTVVQPGKALLVLAPDGAVQLVLQIDEKNLGLVSLDQSALASADAYADKRFPAKVTYINPSVDISRASVEVKLTVADPPAYLRQDMTVSVDIEVDRRPAAVVAPSRAIHDPLSAAPWVFVVRDGRAHVQPVSLGLRASDQVEILSGVAPGDKLVPVSAGVRAGQRLREVAP